MEKIIWLVVLLALIFPGALEAKNNRSVVLPLSEAQSIARLCSREPLPVVEGGWLPSQSDLAAMERRFPQISKLQSKSEDSGISIKAPRSYYRQYIGVTIMGRKYIYINAFCEKKPPSDWREKLVNDCDGGCNWGVLYEVQTGSFSGFSTNGIA
jgi:hypothetical protein